MTRTNNLHDISITSKATRQEKIVDVKKVWKKTYIGRVRRFIQKTVDCSPRRREEKESKTAVKLKHVQYIWLTQTMDSQQKQPKDAIPREFIDNYN